MNLYECLEEYKVLTLKLIEGVKKDVELNSLFESRENILKSIKDINFDKKEIKNIVSSLGILELEEELKNSVIKEKNRVKKQIENLKKTRQANEHYNNIANIARVLNKSV